MRKHKTVVLSTSQIGTITMCLDCKTLHLNLQNISVKIHNCLFDEFVRLVLEAVAKLEILSLNEDKKKVH